MADKNHNIQLPPEFSGHAQLMLYTRYGDPREPGWEHKWVDQWHVQQEFPWFPETHIHVHKHFRAMLTKAFKQLEYNGLHKEIKSCDGCFKVRNTKNDNSVISLHAWGVALDMNAEDNPHGSFGVWSPAFIKVMRDNDIYCGQDWGGRKDPMHFAMLDG